MKGTFLITLIVVFCMLAIPLSALPTNPSAKNVSATVENSTYNKPDQKTSFSKIKVLKNGTVSEFSTKEYIFGVVAAEMPALFHEEALKAQAVAAYTYACYRINNADDSEYHITADGDTAQCFITREEATVRWGDKAQEYSKKIDSCISAVENKILTFEGEPILAAYHAMSSGSTNACADVWGEDLPYLKSVDSAGDKLAEEYLSVVEFTPDQIAEKLKSITTAFGEPKNYFTDVSTTDNGLVKNISFCNKTTSGSQICKLLGLRSNNFTISFSNNVFTFTVKGYGHGVGMSQTGADYMAKQGSSYEEILLHYYNGAMLS